MCVCVYVCVCTRARVCICVHVCAQIQWDHRHINMSLKVRWPDFRDLQYTGTMDKPHTVTPTLNQMLPSNIDLK